MNVSSIGNIFAPSNVAQQQPPKAKPETAGVLAFGSETAGSLANNVGGSFSAIA